jgi:hypothetical protein
MPCVRGGIREASPLGGKTGAGLDQRRQLAKAFCNSCVRFGPAERRSLPPASWGWTFYSEHS